MIWLLDLRKNSAWKAIGAESGQSTPLGTVLSEFTPFVQYLRLYPTSWGNFGDLTTKMTSNKYCPASQEWQWRHVLFTKLPGNYNQ